MQYDRPHEECLLRGRLHELLHGSTQSCRGDALCILQCFTAGATW